MPPSESLKKQDFSVLNQAFPAGTTPPPPAPGMLDRAKGYGIGLFNKMKSALTIPGAGSVDPNNPLKGIGMGEAQGKQLIDRNDYRIKKQLGEVP